MCVCVCIPVCVCVCVCVCVSELVSDNCLSKLQNVSFNCFSCVCGGGGVGGRGAGGVTTIC